jgi:hypothetical protein
MHLQVIGTMVNSGKLTAQHAVLGCARRGDLRREHEAPRRATVARRQIPGQGSGGNCRERGAPLRVAGVSDRIDRKTRKTCKSGPVFATLPEATRARLDRLQRRGEVCGVAPSLSGLVAAAVAAGLPTLEREAGVVDLIAPTPEAAQPRAAA